MPRKAGPQSESWNAVRMCAALSQIGVSIAPGSITITSTP
jgi:hypothetical protein